MAAPPEVANMAAASAAATQFNGLIDTVFSPYPTIWTEDRRNPEFLRLRRSLTGGVVGHDPCAMLSQSTKLTPLGSQTAVARDYYIREFKGDKTVNELASEYDIHPTQINQWKRQALASLLVGVEAEDAEREGQQQALEQRQQEALGDADGGAHELVLGGLVDQVDQVQALGPSRSP